MTTAEIVRRAEVSTDLERLADTARPYGQASKSAATLRAYRSDWRQFTGWCETRGFDPLPADPAAVALYLSDRAGVLAVATLQRHLTSISQAHQHARHDSPTGAKPVREVWRGIRRTFGVASQGKAPLLTDDIRAMAARLDRDRLIDIRDRALLLIAYAGALRRSELVALVIADLADTPDGLVVTIRRSKTDQEGEGATIGLPYGSDPATCPVRAYRVWLEAASITEGAIFRRIDRHGRLLDGGMSGRAAAERVKRLAGLVGRYVPRIGAHSLRAGLITQAVTNGAHERYVMRHSRHKSVHVFRTYVRDIGLFEANAAASAGL